MVKGALDQILNMCVGFLEDGVRQIELTMHRREEIFQLGASLGISGLRGINLKHNLKYFFEILVVAMACGKDLNTLYYVGIVGIMDPPRPNCRESIESVQMAGVNVKMVTGDSKETACSVGLFFALD